MERIPEVESISDMAVARRFNEFMGGHRFRQQDYRYLARQVVGMGIPPGGKVLDIGTGSGFVGLEVARRLRGTGCVVVGIDLSQAMLALAAENAQRRGMARELEWQHGDAKAMPFDDHEFDLVVSSDSMHHWEDPLPVLNEMARVLKPGGKYLIHDLRRPQRRAQRLVSWLMSVTIPPDLRVHYKNSIQSAYTPDEVRSLLECSRLQDWRIRVTFLTLTVVQHGGTRRLPASL